MAQSIEHFWPECDCHDPECTSEHSETWEYGGVTYYDRKEAVAVYNRDEPPELDESTFYRCMHCGVYQNECVCDGGISG